MLSFVFDERFCETFDGETRELICRIKQLRDAGKTYRAIEAELGFSRSKAWRLAAKWTPALSEQEDSEKTVSSNQLSVASEDEDEIDEQEEAQYQRDVGLDDAPPDVDDAITTPAPASASATAAATVPESATTARSVYDLPVQLDGWGKEIYVESEQEHTGRPKVWYRIDKDNHMTRFVRHPFYIRATRIGVAPYIPDEAV